MGLETTRAGRFAGGEALKGAREPNGSVAGEKCRWINDPGAPPAAPSAGTATLTVGYDPARCDSSPDGSKLVRDTPGQENAWVPNPLSGTHPAERGPRQ